jgi:uncharacterized protein (DUF1330 family)
VFTADTLKSLESFSRSTALLPACLRLLYQQGENIMNRYMTAGLSMLVGAALGGAAIQILHAQTKPHAYVIGEITIKDHDGYLKEFAPAVVKAQEASGGKFLARGGKTDSQLGSPPAPRVIVVEYDSLDQAQAWWNSQATKDAFAIGKRYADFRQFTIEGLAP